VGFGTSEFSPHAAKKEEIELILPITIRYNETTSREGQIKITAVRGELESLTGLIEDVCIKAEENPGEEIVISRDMFFTYPVEYDRTKLCMVDSCKKVDCNLPIKFEDIKRKGEYYVEISYSSGIINVRT
ncbi:MAG: hypothetical protein KAU95_00160, partial [Candidatus Aenigmarchaeota archaeon]|nr:hypothetical protein [Candidatus Aenigmarchaeota archaeon]